MAINAFKVNAVIQAGYDKNSLRRANQEIANSFGSLSSKMSRVAASARAAQTIFMTTGAGIVASFGAGAMAAASFEEQFVRVKKTLDIKGESTQVERSFNNIGKRLRELTKLSPVTTDAITEIAAVGGQLGVAAKDIVSFTDTIQKLTVATNLSAENAALAMSRLQEITGSTVSELDNLGSTLVALGNNFAAQESEIVNAAMQIATSTAQIEGAMNNAAVDALAFATALKAIGQPSQAGATAIVRLMTEMSEAIVQGGDSLEIFAQVARMSVPAFEELFKIDSSQAVAAFIKGLNDTSSVGLTNVSVLQKLGLGQVRTQKAILALAKANGTLYDALDTANKAYSENIALTEEAERRYETLFSELAKGRNIIKAEFIDFGLENLDSAKEIVKDINNFLIAITKAAVFFARNFATAIIPLGAILGISSALKANINAAAVSMQFFAQSAERANAAGMRLDTVYGSQSKGGVLGRMYNINQETGEIDPMFTKALEPKSAFSGRIGLPFGQIKRRGLGELFGRKYSQRVLDTVSQPQLMEMIYGGQVPNILKMPAADIDAATLTSKGKPFKSDKAAQKQMSKYAYQTDYFERFSDERRTFMPTAFGQGYLNTLKGIAKLQDKILNPQFNRTKAFWKGTKNIATSTYKTIANYQESSLKSSFVKTGESSKLLAAKFRSNFDAQVQKIDASLVKLGAKFQKNFGFIFRGFKDFASLWVNGFKDGISGLIKFSINQFKTLGNYVKNNFGFVFRGLKDFGSLWINGLRDGIVGISKLFYKNFGFVFRGLRDFGKLWIDGFKLGISDLGKAMTTVMAPFMQQAQIAMAYAKLQFKGFQILLNKS